MGRYIIRRLLRMIVVLFVISMLAFSVFTTLGDPAVNAVPRGASPETITAVRHRMGLDKPKWVQYREFITRGPAPYKGEQGRGLLRLPPNLGYSFRNQEPVRELIMSRVPVTASLTFGAAALWIILGIPIGILASTKPRSIRDRIATGFALVGVSMPSFFFGLIVLYLLFYRLRLAGVEMFPAPGYIPFTQNPLDWAHHLILPWATLGLINVAVYSRMVRGTMLETLGEDYIRTARAKGLSERRVTYRHALRSALTPVVTLLGLDVGLLLGGAIITEKDRKSVV